MATHCTAPAVACYVVQAAKRKQNGTGASISGKDAFVLYDTYGFPLEITQELAAGQGVAVDLEGFAQQMQVRIHTLRSCCISASAMCGMHSPLMHLALMHPSWVQSSLGKVD